MINREAKNYTIHNNNNLVVNWQWQHSVGVEQEIVRDVFAFQESGWISDCQSDMSASPCRAANMGTPRADLNGRTSHLVALPSLPFLVS